MGVTNFDEVAASGQITSMGVPVLPGLPFTTGTYYFVSSGATGSNNHAGTSKDRPMATIDAAINRCTADAGDVIVVLPGHAETVADATTIVPDVAGVTIFGLGRGTKRPTLTLSAATSNIPISGANVVFQNFLIVPTGTVDVTSAITVTGADVLVKDVEMRDASATSQIATGVTLSTGAARATVDGLVYRGITATGDAGAAGVSCAVAIDGVTVKNCWIDGLLANGGIYNVTNAMTNVLIKDCITRNRHATRDSGINLVATTTGDIVRCYHRSATHDADGFNLGIVADDCQKYQSYVVNLDSESGGLASTASTA